ncbi:phage tail tape measure protein [Photorhabdus temperata]|uniref:Phage tail tape measure protein, lambda family n=1 Tax=Photorhabdus temperata subsp. temperata Meg1 TaxID=1393735 RepID=A0A081RS58_PHOTE|nr:phage tail tape measure protein [Photorhabdus temperata]KER01511.1 phage tail tape measure protein, lambda family [Photorhabdus temperata subsp. temperata Meg1]MCT8349520.1 phage tail tape measure protein [Photorhabdus temperata]
MSDIATISLRLETSDLERGNQELNKFQSVAEKASKASSGLNEQFKSGIDTQKRAAETLKEQRNELGKVLDRLNPTNKAFAELDKMAEKLNKARDLKIINETVFNKYNAIIESTNKRLYDMEAALTEEGRAKLIEAQASKRAETAAKSFLDALKLQTDGIGKTKTELLELKAAQIGVSQQAAPFIAKLKQQDQAFMRGAITAGQYKMAMHQLPMQVTDIVTSLASGMPIWLIAIQQGGQIKDSFGGIGNTFKALTTLITPMRIAMAGLVGGVAAALYGLYKAYDVAEKESSAFNKAVILTGSYSGVTARQLASMASEVGKSNGTVGKASEVLSKLAGAGISSSVNLKAATQSIIEFSRYSGQSIDDLVKQFSQLSDDPAGGSLALTKNMHYLTAAQYQHIAALQKEGDKASAVAAATDALNGAIKQRADEIRNNMGTLPKFFDEIERSASKMWDGIMGLGRDPSDAEKRAELVLKIRSAENDPRRYNGKGKGLSYISNDTLAQWKKELASIDEQAKKKQNIAKLDQDAIDAQLTLTKLTEAGVTAAEKRVKATKDLNEAIKDNAKAAAEGRAKLWSKEEIDKARAGIESLYKDTKTPKGKSYRPDAGIRTEDAANRQLLALQAQLKVLQDHKSINDVISAQRRQLWLEEAKYTVLHKAASKRKLDDDEKALLANEKQALYIARQNAYWGDQIALLERRNKLHDDATKYIEKMNGRIESLREARGLSSREAERKTALRDLESDWKSKGGSVDDEEYLEKVKSLKGFFAEQDKERQDWQSGFQKGFADYQDTATNVYGNVASIAQNSFVGMGNVFSDFLTTGKAGFKDFATSVLKQITQMITQMLVFKSIEMGASAFGFSLPGMASGGYTGPGGKFEPRGIVHGGEFVFTKEATNRIGVGNLYSMMHSAQGYANGGYVGGAQVPNSQILQPAPRYGLVPAAGGVTVQTSVYIDGGSQQKGADAGSVDMSGITKQINGAIDKAITVQLTKTGSPLWNATYGRR